MEDHPNSPSWQMLRSDIYIRDKGICWICNTFVDLKTYDLGHLIDRCNNGHDNYDNLAVMHKSCNLSKPPHKTLEEALKWKLTFNIPQPRLNYHTQPKTKRIIQISPQTLAHRQEIYKEQMTRIKPKTICWKQGEPFGGAMWKVLPPPYRQEDLFTMRQTPLGAKDSGTSIKETIQVLNGELTQDVDINVGCLSIHISTNGDIKLKPNSKANVGLREHTIGMGRGQIPLPTRSSVPTRFSIPTRLTHTF